MSNRTSRRGFVLGGAGTAFSILASRKALSWAALEQRVEVQTTSELGTIRPELHGHFAEHLGSCVYGGLWVGKNSKIANVDGYRKQAVDWLKTVGVPVLRWPGGCFADDYHWRDGIGPAAKRKRSVNIHWGSYTEDNSFGTHEFLGLCRLIGAEPYLAGNVGSGTPQELRDWVEYCNYPSGSSLSDERVANGSPQPFNVRYWGVGNENWGCGGNMQPAQYANEYRKFAGYIRQFGNSTPFLIACGPNKNNLDWTRGFFENMNRRPPNGFAMHFYSNSRVAPTQFTQADSDTQLATFAELEKAILEQRALIDKYDSQKRVGMLVDEWGVWDRMIPDEEKRYGRLWQQITMRSAVAAALGLNVFHRQADKLVMCNIAQMVNVLHALLLTDEDKCVRTSTYYAFELMKAHRGGRAVRVEQADPAALGLSVSASRKDRELVVSFVNPKNDAAMSVNCSLSGATAAEAKAHVLHHEDLNACNTFQEPGKVVPGNLAVSASGGAIKLSLPPMSVATVTVRLV
jgi:alpha-N-arabinofuranosidase